MKYKKLVVLLSLSALLAACNDKEEVKKEESKDESTHEIVQTILEDNSVIDSEIVEQENEVQLKVEVNDNFDEKTAGNFIKQYKKELEKIYNDKNVHIEIVKENKIISSTKVEKEVPQEEQAITNHVKVTVKELVGLEIIQFKENPVSKQLSVLVYEDEMKDYVKKEVSDIFLVLGEERFKFETNQFDESLLQVTNTNFTEEQLLLANIEWK